MKTILSILLIVTVVTQSLRAQNVNLNWVAQLGGTAVTAAGQSITTDPAGNIYITGIFKGRVDFDPGAGVFNMRSGNNGASTDVFVCKLDPSGALVWAKQMGGGMGIGDAHGYSIALDPSGNIYTAGTFSGTIDFDPGVSVFNLNSTGGTFISKIDANGNFIWAKQIATTFVFVSGNVIAADGAGNVFITGSFSNVVDFDPGAGVFNLTANDYRSMFVLKLDAAGNFAWVKQAGGSTGTDDANGASLKLDAPGNIFVTGSFAGTVDFDPGSGVANLGGNSTENIFVAKYDPAGNYVWAKQMAGSGNSAGICLATNPSGAIYTAGFFEGVVDFDPGAAAFNCSAITGNVDIFISKLDANGNFIWAKQLSGTGFDAAYGLATDAGENAYITGAYSGTGSFDSATCAISVNTGSNGFFISKINANGSYAWTKQMGGSGYSLGNSVTIDGANNVYSTGAFYSSIDFDPNEGESNFSSEGNYDIFVHKMSPCTNQTSAVIAATACHDYTLNCKTYTSSGQYTQVIPNAAGCDSIITLNLTINNANSTTTIDTTVCNSYFFNDQNITTSGIYTDTIFASQGCNGIITLHLTIKSASLSSITQSICNGQSYLGYNKSGNYIDTLTATNGCDSIRTLHLTVLQNPNPQLGTNDALCSGDTLVLYPGIYSSYLWQDGSVQSHYTAKQPGLYSVQVSNICGTGQASISIKQKVCNILFPTAFTPNNDNKNDFFKILNAPLLNNFKLSVYNRWGQVVFETTDYKKGWDGYMRGQLSPTGVYTWFCNFKRSDTGEFVEMKGTVVLLR